jgi:hypothetical protein
MPTTANGAARSPRINPDVFSAFPRRTASRLTSPRGTPVRCPRLVPTKESVTKYGPLNTTRLRSTRSTRTAFGRWLAINCSGPTCCTRQLVQAVSGVARNRLAHRLRCSLGVCIVLPKERVKLRIPSRRTIAGLIWVSTKSEELHLSSYVLLEEGR